VCVSTVARREPDHEVRQSPLHGGWRLERVVAEVVGNERRAHGLSGRARLGIADLLDPLDGLAFLAPQLAGLTTLAIRERDHRRAPTGCRVLGDHAAGTPHEIRGGCADHEQRPSPDASRHHVITSLFAR
jgi:hypothetical protein